MYGIFPFILILFVNLISFSLIGSSFGLENETSIAANQNKITNFTGTNGNNNSLQEIQSQRLPDEFFAADQGDYRDKYLQSWNNTEFQSSFDTFIKSGSAKGYGIYVKHPSENIFKSGDTIELYIEPIGFGHREIFDENGNKLYQINFTSNIMVFDKQGNQILSNSIESPIITSYNKITEHYIAIPLNQEPPFPNGDYVVRYFVTDGTTKQSFELEKQIKIAEIASIT